MRLIDADALMAKIDGVIEYIENEIEQAKQYPEKYARTYIPSAVSQLSGIAHAQQEILEAPTAEPEIIRCKDCKWWGYDDETGDVRVCHAAKHGHISSHWEIIIRRTYRGDFYCADAERRGEQDDKNT